MQGNNGSRNNRNNNNYPNKRQRQQLNSQVLREQENFGTYGSYEQDVDGSEYYATSTNIQPRQRNLYESDRYRPPLLPRYREVETDDLDIDYVEDYYRNFQQQSKRKPQKQNNRVEKFEYVEVEYRQTMSPATKFLIWFVLIAAIAIVSFVLIVNYLASLRISHCYGC